jgi:hypothetical protein
VVLGLLAIAGALRGPAGDGHRPATALPTQAAPTANGSFPAAAPTASVHPTPSHRSVTPSASASVRPTSAAPSTTAPAPSAGSTPTLAPPPASARVGVLTSAGGLCLDLGGLVGLDGSPVQVAGCDGGAGQRWTLETDGTLRVIGRCAQSASDQAVRIVGCDDRSAAQWRRGPRGSLVNLGADGCLTDPGRSGVTTRVAACAGAASQRWSTPTW